MVPTYEEMGDWMEKVAQEFPAAFFEELNGGILLDEDVMPDPDFPEGDISFLYEIPAMRCFKPLSEHGPSGQPGHVRIKKGDEGIHMELVFDFR